MYWQTRTCFVRMVILDRCSVSSRTARIASRTCSVMLGCPPDSRSHRSSAQPDQPEVLLAEVPPDQGAVADLVQAQQPGLLRVQRRQFGDLGVPALGQRGGVRVVLGLRLTRPRAQAAAAAEAGRDLQQVRHPQLGQLPLARVQVIRHWLPAVPGPLPVPPSATR